jgi:predicted transcriptional regulator
MRYYSGRCNHPDIYNHSLPVSYDDDRVQTAAISTSMTALEYFNHMTGLNWFESNELRKKLPAVYQDLLHLFFECCKTQKQCGDILGLTQGNVSAILRQVYIQLSWLSTAANLKRTAKQRDGAGKGRYRDLATGNQVVALVKSGMTKQRDIAAALHISQGAVCIWYKRLDIHPPHGKMPWSLERHRRQKIDFDRRFPWIN